MSCSSHTEHAPNILHTFNGCYEVYLTRNMTPTAFSSAGQVIVVNYTIENRGTLPFCKTVKICDSLIGENCYQCVDIIPCCSQTFSTSYIITSQDTTLNSIPITTVAYVQAKKCEWVKSNCVIQTLNRVV